MNKPPLTLYSPNCPGGIGKTWHARCGCCGNYTDFPHEEGVAAMKRVLVEYGWENLGPRWGWICPGCLDKYELPDTE